MRRSMDDELGAAVAAALAPYAWRELTEPMLARLVVGAVRHSVIHFLTTVPGTDVAGVPRTEPAEAGDERVDAVRWKRGGLSGRRSSRTCGDCSKTTSRANLPGRIPAPVPGRAAAKGLLPGHRHTHRAFTVVDQVAGDVDGDAVQRAGEREG